MMATDLSARSSRAIVKRSTVGVAPNLPDYDRARADFSWAAARSRRAGLPGGGLNIAFEAVDRQARGPLAQTVALRLLSKRRPPSDLTYGDLKRETDCFAGLLGALGVKRGERVFVLAGRIPETGDVMSTDQELRALVISVLTYVAPDIDPAAIDPDAEFVEQLDIDSMDFLNIVVDINEQTGIDVPERDYPKLSTLNDAVSYLAHAQAHVS